MAIPVYFESWGVDLFNGEHNFSADTIMVALCNAANAPDAAADLNIADITQIAYTNLVGRTLTVDSVSEVAGVARVFIDDFNLEASGGSVAAFRYIVMYNDTHASDRLICYYDIGVEVTLLDTQVLPLDFNGVSGAHVLSPA